MAILRTVTCDLECCTNSHQEIAPGVGWSGWGQLNGAKSGGIENPYICPECMEKVKNFLNQLEKGA